VLRHSVILALLLCSVACAKPDNLPFIKIEVPSNDDLQDVVVDRSSNQIYVYPGYVWSRCTEVKLDESYGSITVDTISDKALFDIYKDSKDVQLGVGTDGYLYTKEGGDKNWIFHRMSHWDILHKIVEKPNGYIAAGGKAFETGYLYHINQNYQIDSVQYFGHEIADITNITGDIWLTVGWGNIQRSIDGGKSWQILDIEGDLFLSAVFVNAQHGWIIGANGTLLETNDAGLNWTESKSSLKGSGFDSFTKMSILGDRRLVILGTNGRLWLSEDGNQWQDMVLDTSSDLKGITHLVGDKYIVHGTKGFMAEISL
jgi:hypothetical protein